MPMMLMKDSWEYGLRITKKKEGGTNSEREKLMRRKIPLTFEDYIHPGRQVQVDKWIDNLARAKTFVDTEGRMPSQIAGDAEERRRAQWIVKTKKRKEEPTANVTS